MEPIKIRTASENATKLLAGKLAEIIKAPLIIALDGDLGAGKTTFVSCLVNNFNHIKKIRVQSPTFALARSYPTNPVVHHLDLYRLDQSTNLADLGLLELIDDKNAI
ncbi:MAG: tRNA (adenosine(37)-N6)-threonylcarbamoyltransferase complex ATPase subunit type 1 TsaE, partial [bacterium]|nr:tRNA (adenosine(37)-N6)-threonylcarbamoyltransferase complex ATPase subunit type 1 TsaE [bacterium]